MRFFLRLVIQLDYSFLEDVATHFANGDENIQQFDEEIVLGALDGTADEKLTGLALRLVLSDHFAIPQEGQSDLLGDAERVFAPKQPKNVKPDVGGSGNPELHSVQGSPQEGDRKKKAA